MAQRCHSVALLLAIAILAPSADAARVKAYAFDLPRSELGGTVVTEVTPGMSLCDAPDQEFSEGTALKEGQCVVHDKSGRVEIGVVTDVDWEDQVAYHHALLPLAGERKVRSPMRSHGTELLCFNRDACPTGCTWQRDRCMSSLLTLPALQKETGDWYNLGRGGATTSDSSSYERAVVLFHGPVQKQREHLKVHVFHEREVELLKVGTDIMLVTRLSPNGKARDAFTVGSRVLQSEDCVTLSLVKLDLESVVLLEAQAHSIESDEDNRIKMRFCDIRFARSLCDYVECSQ